MGLKLVKTKMVPCKKEEADSCLVTPEGTFYFKIQIEESEK